MSSRASPRRRRGSSTTSSAPRAGRSGPTVRTVQRHPRARFEYDLLEKVEAGIVLTGSEVKSVRDGKVSLAEAYAKVRAGEMWVLNLDISPYANAGYANHEPKRPRKLLLHRAQIRRWSARLTEKGLTIVPLSLYFKAGLAKVEIALARGRSRYDHREKIRDEIARRELRERKLRRP